MDSLTCKWLRYNFFSYFLSSDQRGLDPDGGERGVVGDRERPGRRVDARAQTQRHRARPHARGLRPLLLHRGHGDVLRAASGLNRFGVGVKPVWAGSHWRRDGIKF